MWKVSLLAFCGITVLHFTVQFLAWSFAPGNTARDLAHLWISKLWPIVSFPLFRFLPRGWDFWSEWQVWGTFCLNSVLWGLVGGLAVACFTRKGP